jgi:hypothetical protein
MTWTGKSWSVGEILTAAQMNNLQADITAQANGDSGAPKNQTASFAALAITTAKLAAGAVTQGKIATSTGEVSVAGSNNLTLAGGEYGFYPQVRVTSGTADAAIASAISNTSYVTNIYLERVSGSGTVYAQQRYITASPPYDLGDGPIPLFMFALINNATGDIEATYVAPEAPWHHNGPTIITPDMYDDNGVPYRFVRVIPSELDALGQAVSIIRAKMRDGDPVTDSERMQMRDFYLGMEAEPQQPQEITQSIKNADMDVIPHPFRIVPADRTVVMLDPLGPVATGLFELHREYGGDFSLPALLHGQAFTIDNNPLTRSGPSGVMQVAFNWRNT